MHRFTAFMMCAAFAGQGLMATHPSRHSFFPKGMTDITAIKGDDLMAKASITKAPKAESKWLPKSQDLFMWAGRNWTMYIEYDLDYNDKGLCIQEDSNYPLHNQAVRKVYSWNENDMLAEGISQISMAGSEFTNYDRVVWEYDPVVTDFIIGYEHTMWRNSAWVVQGDSYKNIVTRNDEGKVISVENRQYMSNGEYRPVSRILIEYEKDGKASVIDEEEVYTKRPDGSYQWENVGEYDNLVWENTDGQILSTDNLFEGANRILSASLHDESSDGEMNVEYGERGSYSVTYFGYDEMNEEAEETHLSCLFLDEFGSQEATQTTLYKIDEEIISSESAYQRVELDAYGLVLLQEGKVELDGRVEQYAKYVGECEYDVTYGYPLTWTFSVFDTDTEELIPATLVEYSDYNEYSGVDAVISDKADEDSEPLYFDLQGRRVCNPAQGGIYIRRTGIRSEKVIVK